MKRKDKGKKVTKRKKMVYTRLMVENRSFPPPPPPPAPPAPSAPPAPPPTLRFDFQIIYFRPVVKSRLDFRVFPLSMLRPSRKTRRRASSGSEGGAEGGGEGEAKAPTGSFYKPVTGSKSFAFSNRHKSLQTVTSFSLASQVIIHC